MIYRIYSDLKTFKEITFHPGLNILLADKTPEATERQTRNSSGKSSLVQIIHFLIGANCDKTSIFRTDALTHTMFGMEFDLANVKTQVERSGKKPSKVRVSGETQLWPVTPSWERNSMTSILTNDNWKQLLGKLMFGLNGESDEKFQPPFRSMFTYFARRQEDGGFLTPQQRYAKQTPWDEQVSLSYLMGLDWTIPQQFQFVRQREAVLKKLREAAKEGAFGELVGTSSEMRTKLIVAEERTRRLREQVERFRVLPEYVKLEREATVLTRELAELSNENLIDRESIEEMMESIATETEPSYTALEELYKEAGVVLPDAAIQRFQDVRTFHEAVVANRKTYLQSEIVAAERRIAERERERERLAARRAEIFEILQSHGALDQFSKLQGELSRVEAQTEVIRQQLTTAEQLESGRTELDIERTQMLIRLRQDYQEQEDVIRKAILTFEEISSSLYERAGSLEIQESANGPSFKVKIHGAKSKGINNMQIFCFDMMLMTLCMERGIGPKFLVHDSHLFDGVDDRQVARALSIGAERAKQFGFQYIVTMNSNDLPRTFPNDFQVEEYILPVRLTDATEDGGLFGLRFG